MLPGFQELILFSRFRIVYLFLLICEKNNTSCLHLGALSICFSGLVSAEKNF